MSFLFKLSNPESRPYFTLNTPRSRCGLATAVHKLLLALEFFTNWGMCYLGDLRSTYDHTTTEWSNPRFEVVQEQKDNLGISQVTNASMAQRAECQIQMAEVQGSMLTGVAICCWIFCFHIVKPLMPILPLLPFLCVCKKLDLVVSGIICGTVGLVIISGLFSTSLRKNVVVPPVLKGPSV